MRAAVVSPEALARHPSGTAANVAAHSLFPTRAPAEWVEVLDLPGPLARQVMPDTRETLPQPGFGSDAVGDLDAMVVPGVIHKYAGRVLLVATAACPIHCRYCFRRHFPYRQATASSDNWAGAVAYLASQPAVEEVILSGGDPLTLSTRRLALLTARLAPLEHIRRLRIHTRTPTVVPSRVNDALLEWLESLSLPVVIVLHVNHSLELTNRALEAISRLRSAGAMLLNQSVLLRDVNDDADTLLALSRALVEAGVVPYYLHVLDRVEGARHFEISDDEAQSIVATMRARASGFLVPRLVRENAGDSAKSPLA